MDSLVDLIVHQVKMKADENSDAEIISLLCCQITQIKPESRREIGIKPASDTQSWNNLVCIVENLHV